MKGSMLLTYLSIHILRSVQNCFFSAVLVRERFEEDLTAKSKITRSKLDCLTSICPEILQFRALHTFFLQSPPFPITIFLNNTYTSGISTIS